MDAATQTELTAALFATRPDPKAEEFRTGLAKLRALERCLVEQGKILTQPDIVASLCVCAESPCRCPGVKAWLVILGFEDWEQEKRLIEAGA